MFSWKFASLFVTLSACLICKPVSSCCCNQLVKAELLEACREGLKVQLAMPCHATKSKSHYKKLAATALPQQ